MENSKVYDLSGDISPELLEAIDKAADQIRGEYFDFITNFRQNLGTDIDWDVLDFISRNTMVSPLYRHIVYLTLIEQKINSAEGLQQICVDTSALGRVLKQYCCRKYPSTIVTIVNHKRNLSQAGIRIAKLFYSLWHHGRQFFWAGATRRPFKEEVNHSLTLIDTFILPDSFEDGSYTDRYYGDVLKYASDEEREKIRYVGNYYRIKDYKGMFRAMRKSYQGFLIKEDYLTISDYLFALGLPFRLIRKAPNRVFFRSFDVTPIIHEEIMESAFSRTAHTALLNYRFSRRMRERGIQLKHVVNWFENQGIDHGFNKGISENYPDVSTLGYIGFPLPDNYLSVYPTTNEIEEKKIPKTIAVMGSGYVDAVRRYAPQLKVCVMPAFRYSWLWQLKPPEETESFITRKAILIALPILVKESVRILKLVAKGLEDMPVETVFYIKPHPACETKVLKKNFGECWPESFKLVSGSFHTWLSKTDFVISSASSTTLEPLIQGKPCIVVGGGNGLTLQFIPKAIPMDIWCICYSAEEITRAIMNYSTVDSTRKKQWQVLGLSIREQYFEEVTRKKARNFLGFEYEGSF